MFHLVIWSTTYRCSELFWLTTETTFIMRISKITGCILCMLEWAAAITHRLSDPPAGRKIQQFDLHWVCSCMFFNVDRLRVTIILREKQIQENMSTFKKKANKSEFNMTVVRRDYDWDVKYWRPLDCPLWSWSPQIPWLPLTYTRTHSLLLRCSDRGGGWQTLLPVHQFAAGFPQGSLQLIDAGLVLQQDILWLIQKLDEREEDKTERETVKSVNGKGWESSESQCLSELFRL